MWPRWLETALREAKVIRRVQRFAGIFVGADRALCERSTGLETSRTPRAHHLQL